MWIERILNVWTGLFKRLEGAELEPRPWHSHYLTEFCSKTSMDLMGKQLEGRVLDIGAGTGHGARYLDNGKTEYLPTDLPSGRDATDENISTRPKKITVYCSSYALPFPNESMGGVLLLSVLEHLQSPQLALKEACRVLLPGGKMLVSVPFSFPIHGFPFDFMRWTMEGLKMELHNAGFENISESAIGNAFGSIVLNINLLLKYHIKCNRSRMLKGFMSLVAPFSLVSQLFLNCAAIVLGPLDRSNALPLGIVMLGRKKEQSRR